MRDCGFLHRRFCGTVNGVWIIFNINRMILTTIVDPRIYLFFVEAHKAVFREVQKVFSKRALHY